jgi:hypothetical protein
LSDGFAKNHRHSWSRSSQISTENSTPPELDETGADWLPLKGGLLGGSVERAQKVMTGVEEFIGRLQMW